MRSLLPIAFFAIFFSLGYGLTIPSWNGSAFLHVGEERAPAAVRSIRDYSVIDRQALIHSIPKQMLARARTVKRERFIGLILGHPLFIKGNRNGEFACPIQGHPGMFDKVEIVFTGTGISESSGQPKMIVETNCLPSNVLTELRTVWIPMADIFASEAKDQELQLYGEDPVIVRLENIPTQWPQAWVLSSVRLFSEKNPEESLLLETDLLREAWPSLLSFDWNPTALAE